MKASVYLKLETRRAKKNGKYPLKVRVVYQSQYHDYKTKYDLSEAEYVEATSDKPKKEFRKLASEITELKTKVFKIIEDLSVFTYQKFEDAYYERIKDASNLYAIFDIYIANLESEDRITTAFSYTNAKKSFQDFRPKMSLYDVDTNFLKKYQAYRLGKGTSITTIGIYARNLRSIYNFAVSEGIIKKDENYPFAKRKYVIPAGRNIKKALSLEEVSKIFNFKTIPGTFVDRAKDFWMLSYFCNGMNFKDIAMLKIENIDGDMLRFVREKSKLTGQGNKKIISCFLTDEAKSIISKWKIDETEKQKFLFGIIEEDDTPLKKVNKIKQFIKNTNKNLQTICDGVGIEKRVTTYFARHSSATIMKKSGANIAQIQMITEPITDSITRLKWVFLGKNKFPFSLMNLFIDKLLGNDLALSALKLKEILEKEISSD